MFKHFSSDNFNDLPDKKELEQAFREVADLKEVTILRNYIALKKANEKINDLSVYLGGDINFLRNQIKDLKQELAAFKANYTGEMTMVMDVWLQPAFVRIKRLEEEAKKNGMVK